MRVPAALIVLTFAVPLVGATGAGQTPAAPATPAIHSASNCSRTSSYLAGGAGVYRGQPLAPRKLTELPPAIGYMAVYRHIGGCEAPMTMVEYRNPRRR